MRGSSPPSKVISTKTKETSKQKRTQYANKIRLYFNIQCLPLPTFINQLNIKAKASLPCHLMVDHGQNTDPVHTVRV